MFVWWLFGVALSQILDTRNGRTVHYSKLLFRSHSSSRSSPSTKKKHIFAYVESTNTRARSFIQHQVCDFCVASWPSFARLSTQHYASLDSRLHSSLLQILLPSALHTSYGVWVCNFCLSILFKCDCIKWINMTRFLSAPIYWSTPQMFNIMSIRSWELRYFFAFPYFPMYFDLYPLTCGFAFCAVFSLKYPFSSIAWHLFP